MPNAPSVEYRLPENNCPGSRSPEEYGYNYENIEVVTRDNIKLAGWFIYHEKPKEHPTIIFFHGNAGNIGTRLPNVQLMFEENKANIVIVGYRGYGHSQGSPSENGLQFDAEAVLDWTLRCKKISNSNIFVFGRSMGGAVAIHLASKYQHRLCGIIIENTFTSIRDMSNIAIPNFLRFMRNLFVPNFWPSIDLMHSLTLPILFISGRQDSLIPCCQMDRLYNQAENSIHRKLYKVRDGDHNDTWAVDSDHYFNEITDFIDKAQQNKLKKD